MNLHSLNRTGSVGDLGSKKENVMSYTLEYVFPNSLELERFKMCGLSGKQILTQETVEKEGKWHWIVRIRSEHGI